MNQLYYGDNLQVLREQIVAESIDLIYLDPRSNSKRDDNLLFQDTERCGERGADRGVRGHVALERAGGANSARDISKKRDRLGLC